MKTKLITILFLLVSKLCIAQLSPNDKKIYLDSTWNETSQENSKYYRIVKDYYLDQKEYKVLIYYKNNQLKEESTLNGKDGGSPNGEKINFYENGNKQSVVTYLNGRPTGKTTNWYENGNKREDGEYTGNYEIVGKYYRLNQYWDEKNNHLIIDGNGLYSCGDTLGFRETGSYKDGYKDGVFEGKDYKLNTSYSEKYENGKFISGTRLLADGTKTDYFEMETKPVPRKGMQDFYNFIGKNFNYTKESIKNNIQGKIILQFVIDNKGQIVEPKTVKRLGYGLDEEAVRVLQKYGDWIPGEQRGIKVRCSFSLPLSLQAVR
jgi:Gram-negative bacterial TonB protein C-terminal